MTTILAGIGRMSIFAAAAAAVLLAESASASVREQAKSRDQGVNAGNEV
jgi:hypothetical protein